MRRTNGSGALWNARTQTITSDATPSITSATVVSLHKNPAEFCWTLKKIKKINRCQSIARREALEERGWGGGWGVGVEGKQEGAFRTRRQAAAAEHRTTQRQKP